MEEDLFFLKIHLKSRIGDSGEDHILLEQMNTVNINNDKNNITLLKKEMWHLWLAVSEAYNKICIN